MTEPVMSEERKPRTLYLYPLGPGEFPVEGDYSTSVLDESKDIALVKYQNGQWGIFHWSWPGYKEPSPPEITYD